MDWKCELSLWLFTWDWILVIRLSKFWKVWLQSLASRCVYNSWQILARATVPLHRIDNPITLRKWTGLQRIYKASSEDPSSFFSRAQSCCLWNWLDCGDLKVFATSKWAHKLWTEFNRVTYWTREKTSVTVLRWVLIQVQWIFPMFSLK